MADGPLHLELDAFHDDLLVLEDDLGRPVRIIVPEALHPANQRLMDFLGVEVRVVTQTASVVTRCPKTGCTWNFVGDPVRARMKLREHEQLMPDQLTLLAQPPKLTERQQRALDALKRAGWDGLTATELGARVHGHHSCRWCKPTGVELGKALRKKGLACQRRRDRGLVWTVARELQRPPSGSSSFGEFPEGF